MYRQDSGHLTCYVHSLCKWPQRKEAVMCLQRYFFPITEQKQLCKLTPGFLAMTVASTSDKRQGHRNRTTRGVLYVTYDREGDELATRAVRTFSQEEVILQ